MTGENRRTDPIAVIGVACRVPGADGPGRLWANLAAGVDSVAAPSPRRRAAAVPTAPGLPTEGGYLDSVDEFDADFFGISPREAVAMDPQQRLALELAWEGLEDAGIVPGDLSRRPVGVFVGSMCDDYALLLARHGSQAARPPRDDRPATQHRSPTGSPTTSACAARACSSTPGSRPRSWPSHLACESLRVRRVPSWRWRAA